MSVMKCENISKVKRPSAIIETEDYDYDDFPDSPNGSLNCTDRKRRRGIIEKRRRDRINSCLTELKLLVPDAAQKQNSTKLEKAEILQLSVAFLKRLHQENYVMHNERRAADLRFEGFQECLNEVVRFANTHDSSVNGSSSCEASTALHPVDEFRTALFYHMQEYTHQKQLESHARLAQLAQVSSMLSDDSTSQISSLLTSEKPNASTTYGDSVATGSLKTANLNANSTREFPFHCNDPLKLDNKAVNKTSSPTRKAHSNKKSKSRSNHKSSVPVSSANNSGTSFSTSPSLLTAGGPNESQSTTSPSVPSNLEETDMFHNSSHASQTNLSPGNSSVSQPLPSATLQLFMNRMYGGGHSTSAENFASNSNGFPNNTQSDQAAQFFQSESSDIAAQHWYSTLYGQRNCAQNMAPQTDVVQNGNGVPSSNPTSRWHERINCESGQTNPDMMAYGQMSSTFNHNANPYYGHYENQFNLYKEY